MEPDRREPPEEDEDAAAEFDEPSTAVTDQRELPDDVKKRLKYEQDVRRFLEHSKDDQGS